MEFPAFADRLAVIEDEPADLETVALVAALFRDAGADLPVVARFVQGRVFPAHESAKLDIGPRLCQAAIARSAGRNVTASDVEDRLAERGEIGAVAESYDFGGQRGLAAFSGTERAGLTVAEVDSRLRELAAAEGAGSQDRKLDALFGLLNRASPLEARYLVRLVLGEMRIGVGEGTVRDAIAEAFETPVDAVERALQVSNDYGLVAVTARDGGAAALDDIHLAVGRPVQAMLAQAGNAADALEEWGSAAVETKFDGARVQIHVAGDRVGLFSRNMEDVTDALPELVEYVEATFEGPAIVDGEAVAVADDGTPLPFQEILKRFRRKHDVDAMREAVRVELSAFDCLHAGGEDLLDVPLRERRVRLGEVVPEEAVSSLVETDDADEVAALEADALAAGHEGIMLKDPVSTYTPGSRGKKWLKRKPDVETLDLVVVGAEWGEGRRASLFGTFLVAARDGDDYLPVGKVATGITDEELAELTELLEPHVRNEAGKTIDIEPAVVFEVGYEEIQASPTYGSGFALRFPRFVGVRADREPRDAETVERLERLAAAQ